MKISKLSSQSNCTPETIRYYEQQGLLKAPPRNDANYRVYQPSHLERIKFIRHCRGLDLSLDEIRQLLQFKDAPHLPCEGVNEMISQQLLKVSAQIKTLGELKRQLQVLKRECTAVKTAQDCGILTALEAG
jgi:Cd(II)/Pb(II)-responsive transcriptional regulator